MMGLLATPNLSSAKDGDGRHHLLNAELRAKVERLRDRIEEHRERHHNNQGVPGSISALQSEIANLKTALATANGQLSALDGRLKTLETSGGGGSTTNPALTELAKYVKVDPNPINGLKGPHVVFHHANVHVQSGSGTTFEASGVTGLGNLIVGYNEGTGLHTGSHNLVVGPSHTYTSTGGVVFGESNTVLARSAVILGGFQNRNEGQRSSILGAFQVNILPAYVEYTIP
jgi:hypothetical protein